MIQKIVLRAVEIIRVQFPGVEGHYEIQICENSRHYLHDSLEPLDRFSHETKQPGWMRELKWDNALDAISFAEALDAEMGILYQLAMARMDQKQKVIQMIYKESNKVHTSIAKSATPPEG